MFRSSCGIEEGWSGLFAVLSAGASGQSCRTDVWPTVASLYSPYSSSLASLDSLAADGDVASQSAAVRKLSEGPSIMYNDYVDDD
jgi:hypothetical protein